MPRWPWSKKRKLRHLREPIERHLGMDLALAQSVTHAVKPVERLNIQRVLDRWAADARPPVEALGYSSTGYLADDSLVRYLINDEVIQAPVERTQLENGLDTSLDCMVRGLFLLRRNGAPLVIVVRPPHYSTELPVLEIIASTREAARDSLAAMVDEAKRGSVYKGRTLSLEPSGSWREGFNIRFHQIRPTAREEIVLPDELICLVERNVLGMLKHAGTLRAAGRSLRRGLLFHGPPGTGKTMVIRYLTHACPDHTVILMAGAQQALVTEACHIARVLAPSIVVMEDIDLVAEERESNRCPAVLHELMNEMDGLGPQEEVTFLLTTNRPEVIEPALSARPGRIDQAVAFPLPDDASRRRLFEVYGRGLDLTGVDVARWVTQTSGVSPAFIEELLRKAALLAAERGEPARPLRISDADIHDALRELIFFGGELTQKLLGYRPTRIGYQA